MGAAKYGIHGTNKAKIKAIVNTFQGGDGYDNIYQKDSRVSD